MPATLIFLQDDSDHIHMRGSLHLTDIQSKKPCLQVTTIMTGFSAPQQESETRPSSHSAEVRVSNEHEITSGGPQETYGKEIQMVLAVAKVHRVVLVVNVFRHGRRIQRDLGWVDRPRGCLSSGDRRRTRATLCGRQHLATQVHEFARKRLRNQAHSVVHVLLGVRGAAVDDDVVDDPRRNRDHAAYDRGRIATDSTRLAWGIILARKDGDTPDLFFLVVQVEVIRRPDRVFGEPDEDLEDPEVLDRLKVGREVDFADPGHSDVRPGGLMGGRHRLLGINVVILGDPSARLLALFEAC